MTSPKPSRRQVLKQLAGFGLWAGAGGWAAHRLLGGDGPVPVALAGSVLDAIVERSPPARFWTSPGSAETAAECAVCHTESGFSVNARTRAHAHVTANVRCFLCAQRCSISAGKSGMCGVRANVDGTLRSLVYGRPLAQHVDPIEKKPFYHFLPGQSAYSIATAGCPLSCRFCQNWQLSQAGPADHRPSWVSPQAVAGNAHGRQAPIIAFTYNEPTVFAEYLIDIAKAAKKRDIRSVLVSCGFMTERPLAEMCEVLDGVKIDLKGFDPDFYRKLCDAELEPVLRSIRQVQASGTHLELVNLVIPTLNDDEATLTEMAKWIAGELGPDVPVHFTRFHPDYRLRNLPPTPQDTLERARAIAMDQGIRYAYVGNLPGHPGNHTHCPGCGEVVIERKGFFVTGTHLEGGRCAHCGAAVAGVWS